MKLCKKTLTEIVKDIDENNEELDVEEPASMTGWTEDIVKVRMTKESLYNLRALTKRFGDLKPTEEELDTII